jgi:hypothetical protein
MNKYIGIFLILIIFPFYIFGQTIALTKLNASQIPKEIKYEGKIKTAHQFTDSAGKHTLITSETGIYRNPKLKHLEDGKDAELFAYHYLENQGKTSLVGRFMIRFKIVLLTSIWISSQIPSKLQTLIKMAYQRFGYSIKRHVEVMLVP